MIKPCPFCNSNNISAGYYGQPAKYMFIQCHDCGAQGPNAYRGSASGMLNIKETSKVVMDAWNKRSTWISVEDSLPDEGTPVWAAANGCILGIFERFCDAEGWLWAIVSYTPSHDGKGADWTYEAECDDDYSHITHWQPPPPEE